MLLNEEMNLEDMVKNTDFKYFLCFKGELPYKLNIQTDLYQFEINVNINGEYNSKNEKRKILFTTCQECLQNQQMVSKSVEAYNLRTQLYTNIISKFQICVELFDDEMEYVLGPKSNAENLHSRVKCLYQTILSYISMKYNQSLLGNAFISVSIEDVGAGIVYIFLKDGSVIKSKFLNIIPRFSVDRPIKHSKIDFKSILNNRDIIWLYYFNLAVYSFDRQDYLNTIIYCAISLESYLNYLLEINNLENDFLIYNEDLKSNDKVPGFYSTCKFLKTRNIIKSELNKLLKECYGTLKDQRNDIIHGNIKEILLNRIVSEKSINKLNNIYITYEQEYIK